MVSEDWQIWKWLCGRACWSAILGITIVAQVHVGAGPSAAAPVAAAVINGPEAELEEAAVLDLPSVFTDHMVLQSGLPLRFWGQSQPGAEIELSFGGQRRVATVDASGAWQLDWEPLSISAAPRSLEFTATKGGRVLGQRVLRDVLVGEVWLCSGQSNMEWAVGRIAHYPGVEGGESHCARPAQPQIRIFSDPDLPVWEQRGWQVAGGAHLRAFSATAYFFGQALQADLAVPVGLIHVSRGGSPIQQWIPEPAAHRDPLIRKYSRLFRENREAIERSAAEFQGWLEAQVSVQEAGAVVVPRPQALSPDLQAASAFYGHGLYEQLIEPLTGFAIRGVIWYQGEANAVNAELAQGYCGMLEQLFSGWRAAWGRPALPFHVVQLPCWEAPDAVFWPDLRQAQLRACEQDAAADLVVIFDLCDPRDLHPGEKPAVGQRIAANVLACHYGGAVAGRGPLLESVRQQGNELCLSYATGGAGLAVPAEGLEQLLEVAGDDGRFYPADWTVVEAQQLRVAAAPVTEPVALRYGWRPVFFPGLYSTAGIPLSPFFLRLRGRGGFDYVATLGAGENDLEASAATSPALTK